MKEIIILLYILFGSLEAYEGHLSSKEQKSDPNSELSEAGKMFPDKIQYLGHVLFVTVCFLAWPFFAIHGLYWKIKNYKESKKI